MGGLEPSFPVSILFNMPDPYRGSRGGFQSH